MIFFSVFRCFEVLLDSIIVEMSFIFEDSLVGDGYLHDIRYVHILELWGTHGVLGWGVVYDFSFEKLYFIDMMFVII